MGSPAGKPGGDHRKRLVERPAGVIDITDQVPADKRRHGAVAGVKYEGADGERLGNEYADGGGKPHEAEQHHQYYRRGKHEAEDRESLRVRMSPRFAELPGPEHNDHPAYHYRNGVTQRHQQEAQQQPPERLAEKEVSDFSRM